MDDESKLTLHGLVQHYVMLHEEEKNRKLTDLLDALDFNQVGAAGVGRVSLRGVAASTRCAAPRPASSGCQLSAVLREAVVGRSRAALTRHGSTHACLPCMACALVDAVPALAHCAQVVIFVKSVQRAKTLNALLNECNFPSVCIYAGMPQDKRLDVYKNFKDNQVRPAMCGCRLQAAAVWLGRVSLG